MTETRKMLDAGWKIDRLKWVMAFVWAGMGYLIFPAIPLLTAVDLGFPVDATTFYVVFVTLFMLRFYRIAVHPPMYKKVLGQKRMEKDGS